MSGEIGLKISKIRLTKFEDDNYEMCFYDSEGGHLHIIGDNDLKKLLEDALNNIQKPYKILMGDDHRQEELL